MGPRATASKAELDEPHQPRAGGHRRQTIGPNHQYPDGFVLYLGTMFAPVEDRDAPGQGFTHKVGDLVTIASPKLGRLQNRSSIAPTPSPGPLARPR